MERNSSSRAACGVEVGIDFNCPGTRRVFPDGSYPFGGWGVYPAGIPGRVLPVWRVGSDLKTRGFPKPAGNRVTGTRLPAGFRLVGGRGVTLGPFVSTAQGHSRNCLPCLFAG